MSSSNMLVLRKQNFNLVCFLINYTKKYIKYYILNIGLDSIRLFFNTFSVIPYVMLYTFFYKNSLRDGLKKKELMEFSIKLAGWVLDALVFH